MNSSKEKNKKTDHSGVSRMIDHGRILTALGLCVVIIGAAALSYFLVTSSWTGGSAVVDDMTIAEGISGAALIRYRENGKDVSSESDVTEESAEEEKRQTAAANTADRPNVLFLSSYEPTYNTYADQLQGMQGVFSDENITLNVLNMDSYQKRASYDDQRFLDTVRNCLENSTYSAVMIGDDAALSFAMENRDELFRNLPVMFFGINDYSLAEQAAELPNFTGYTESDNIEDTLDMALKMLPHTSRVVAVYDDTTAGLNYMDQYLACGKESRFSGVTFDTIDFSSYTRKEFEKEIAGYTDGTFILCLNASTDTDGNFYSIDAASKMICNAARVPVFRNSIGGYYNGVTAGKTVRFDLTTEEAAEKIVQVIRGEKSISDFPLSEDVPGNYVANYDALQKFSIPISRLPENTIVLNEPVNFSRQFGFVFYPLLIVISGLLLILTGSRVEVRGRKRAEEKQREAATKLRFASEHDVLTGVYNRQTAIRHLHEDSRLQKDPFTLILLDGDNFKDINETYGHQEGDRLLKRLARELEAVADQNNGQVARFGGDEFLVILYNRHMSHSDPLLREIFDIFRQRRSMGIDSISVYVSAGIANSEPNISAASLIGGAELALLQSKKRGKNTYTFFSREMQEEEKKRDDLRNQVLKAVEQEEMYMLFQPQVKTADGSLEGFEALVRIKDSKIGPGIFIPIAEENGWIRKIGRITTDLTIQQISEWRKQGLRVPPVSINYSAEQLDDVEYVYFLRNLLETYHVPAEYIKIEITESLFIDNNQAAEELFTQLKSMGVQLLMDDFGTGYSSLSYLNYIPVDVVKIDKTIADTHLTDENDYFVRDVITLAHDLHKKTICEGIETKEQYEILKKYNCDGIQGYYFGRPLTAEDAAAFMKRETLLP